MEARRLGASGLKVPILGFGTATFGGGDARFRAWGNTQLAEATRLVGVALDAGVTLFDTADAYSGGLAEEILGQAIAARRHEALIATKAAFRTEPGPNGIGTSRHHLIRACEASLRRLRTDRIDLYQLHGFDARTPVDETLRALDDLIRAGKIRHAGCSNYSGWHLMKSLAVADTLGVARLVAHQVYYSLIGREYEWELMPLALDQQVGTIVWSPLAGGQLSGKLRRNRPRPEGSRVSAEVAGAPPAEPERLYRIVDVLDAIAAETGRGVPQIALNWVLHRPSVSAVIIGARDEAQLRQNLSAADWALDAEQVARLDAASAVTPAYPYWHQRATFAERNPPPI